MLRNYPEQPNPIVEQFRQDAQNLSARKHKVQGAAPAALEEISGSIEQLQSCFGFQIRQSSRHGCPGVGSDSPSPESKGRS
jgi:hypothetical protein